MVEFSQYPLLLKPTTAELNTLNETPYTLMYKLINFYSQLKMANHKVSNNKTSCPINITWDCPLKTTDSIYSINCKQSNALLRLLHQDTIGVGPIITYSANYQQQLKFYTQQSRKQLFVLNPSTFTQTFT